MQDENEGCVDLFENKIRSGDYLDYSIEYFKQNLKSLVLMALVFHVPFTFLIYYLIDYGNLFTNIIQMVQNPDSFPFIEIITIYLGLFIYSLYNSTFVHILTFASMKHAYEQVVNGVQLSVKKSLKHGFKRFGWFLLYLIALGTISGTISQFVYFLMLQGLFFTSASPIFSGILFLILFLIIIIVYIYIYIRLYFVPHAININMLNPAKAVKVSWSLTKKKFWRVFWPVIFGTLFIQTIPSSVSSLTSFLPFNDPLVNRIIAAGVISGAALFFPCLHILTTFIFIHLKNEKGDIQFLKVLNNLLKNESEKITFGLETEAKNE